MKTAGPYTITDSDWQDIRDMYYNNVHDWISKRFVSHKPRLVTGLWVTFGMVVWIMSSIVLPLALSE